MADGLEAFSVFGDISLKGGDQVLGSITGIVDKVGALMASPVGLYAAAGAAIVGLGVLAFKSGGEVEGAMNTIKVATGATGPKLAELQKSFKNVASQTPASFGDSAKAIATFSSKMNYHGTELDDVSLKTIKLARITKEDIPGSAEAASKMFANWGMSAKEASGSLDVVLAVSQKTGAKVGDLIKQVTASGSVFRAMGMNFGESAAMVGQFEKAGLKSQGITMALRTAQKAFSTDLQKGFLIKPPKSGVLDPLSKEMNRIGGIGAKNAKAGLMALMDSIKKAPNDTAAAALGFKFLGARASTDMVNGIRSGKINFSGMMDMVGKSPGTVDKTAKSVTTLAGKFGIFVNNIKLALAPFGQWMQNAAKSAMDFINGLFSGKGFGGLNKLTGIVRPVLNAIVGAFRMVVAWVQTNMPLIRKTISTVIGAVIAVWKKLSPIIVPIVKATFGVVATIITTVVKVVLGVLKAGMQLITGDWKGAWKTIVQAYKDEFGGIIKIGKQIIDGLVAGIKAAWGAVTSTLSGLFSGAVKFIKNLLGIHSPSKVFAEIGGHIAGGVAQGILGGASGVSSALASIIPTGSVGLGTLAVAGAYGSGAGASSAPILYVNLGDGYRRVQTRQVQAGSFFTDMIGD